VSKYQVIVEFRSTLAIRTARSASRCPRMYKMAKRSGTWCPLAPAPRATPGCQWLDLVPVDAR
jgi:hypothetical protein